jgi:hypothetical protein
MSATYAGVDTLSTTKCVFSHVPGRGDQAVQ